MTTPPELPVVAPAGTALAPRRLHPMSWLFVLLVNLREFALPLIVLLFFGSGKSLGWELMGAIGAGAMALVAFVQYLSYRYAVEGAELVIRQGIFSRERRHVPLARIQNVSLHRNPLHRLFGVAEVQLESAAGVKPEAVMRVLSLAQAAELEALVREQRALTAATEAPEQPQEQVLATMPAGEILRLGLISNRGMVVVAGALGLLSQARPDGFGKMVANAAERLFGVASGLQLGPLAWVLTAAVLLLALVALLRAFSIAIAFLQFHGFRLLQQGERLQVESGLLTRIRASALTRRLQHWTISEGWLHRRFGRQSLKVETAVMAAANQRERGLTHLIPLGRPAQVEALVHRLLPQAGWPELPWRGLHPRAWRRMVKPPAFAILFFCGVLALGKVGAWAWLGLLLLPLVLASARGRGRFGAYALTDAVLAFRSGWLDRHWSFVELRRLQGVQLLHTVFDRRNGMATVAVDTAGANPMGHRIHIRYLGEDEARALYARLAAVVGAAPAPRLDTALPAAGAAT
jgi:putative membrane protein